MQAPLTSLNGLRVFLIAARHGSLKLAAQELNVSPGAVSHQVRQLESALGVELFQRANNAIHLTQAGTALARDAAPGLAIMETALADVARDAHELTLSVSTSLAVRWLIPRLDAFRARNPTARIRMETVRAVSPEGAHQLGSDLRIDYHRHQNLPDGADILLRDRCRPYLSPVLLEQLGGSPALSRVPALQVTPRNWDWHLWLARCGWSDVDLCYGASFDLDDAGLKAAVAGMGMILCADFMIADDLEHGRLVALPDMPEHALGYYVLRQGPRESLLSRRFLRWLRSLT